MTDRIAYLLARLHTDVHLTPAEYDECLRLGIKPTGERRRSSRRAELAVKSGCSEQTYRSIFG